MRSNFRLRLAIRWILNESLNEISFILAQFKLLTYDNFISALIAV